ncbi:MAG: type II toxin-antitoxin system VapC family toxin [Dongiaceae bacterium]
MPHRQSGQYRGSARHRRRPVAQVILIDVNLLLYGTIASRPEHSVARGWLESCLNGAAAVGLSWSCLLGFVRLASSRKAFPQPLPFDVAWREVERWLDLPNVWIPGPMERHREILAPLIEKCATRPDLISDAHLAALAIEHGLILCSTDGDFARFPGLRWENPLRPS